MKTIRPERQRVNRLKRIMSDKGVNALLVTKRENVRYLTGFTGSAGSVLMTSGKPWLITDFRYKLQAAQEAPDARVLIQKKDFIQALREAAARSRVETISFDESSLTVEILKKFRKEGFSLRGQPDLTAQLRQVKDRREVAAIAKAVSRAEESFRLLKRFIKPGVTERFLAVKLEFLMRGKGARRAAFDSIVASGPNGAMPHASVSDRPIKKGDLITFDFGAEADGYHSDITRTVCLGRPSGRQREIHALVLKAQQKAIDAIRPDLPCVEVDRAARDTIAAAGFGKNFGHGTGHGIGLLVHEGPSVSPRSQDAVKPGMIFTVEPGVYIPGWGGVRIEDMVHVTEQGNILLTSLTRELEIINI